MLARRLAFRLRDLHLTFPNFLPEGSEIPAIDGLGPVGGGMHTREEFVELESLDRRIVLLAELLVAARE